MVHVEGSDRDILGRKKGSYLSYVPLWVAIMHPTQLKVDSYLNVTTSAVPCNLLYLPINPIFDTFPGDPHTSPHKGVHRYDPECPALQK